ncbi:hypothetical protein FRB93_006890 [Tulasnella sp. JGI-2019a]|nr:hypothetical protein FRB93_006890 [Tulasnella sp. JGI-2019a]
MSFERSTDPVEGLLYAAVRLNSPPIVSLKTFLRWLDDSHIPDLCNAKDGIAVALRYKNTHPAADAEGGKATTKVPYPLLAIYKLRDIHWLTGEGFLSCGHESELFPAEVGHNVFGCCEVQLRSYALVARSVGGPGADKPKYVVTFEIPEADSNEFGAIDKANSAMSGYRGAILYTVAQGLLEYGQRDVPKKGLVVAWFDGMPAIDGTKYDAQVWELEHHDGKQGAEF